MQPEFSNSYRYKPNTNKCLEEWKVHWTWALCNQNSVTATATSQILTSAKKNETSTTQSALNLGFTQTEFNNSYHYKPNNNKR
jgi:hypothetical protein